MITKEKLHNTIMSMYNAIPSGTPNRNVWKDRLINHLTQPTTLDSDVEEIFCNIKPMFNHLKSEAGTNENTLCVIETIEYAIFDPLRTALSDMQQEIDRYKVSVIPNYYNIMKSQKNKLDKVRNIVENSFYCQGNMDVVMYGSNWIKLQQILKEEY